MKTLGLLGGMSWESTVPYYRIINQRVSERLGGLHSARILLYSVDFEEIERAQHAGRWDEAADLLVDAGARLVAGGAELLVVCTNTMHKVAPQLEAEVPIPLLHIADATADAIAADGVSRVALLGTRFTMEQDFYRGRLERKFGLEVVVPEVDARAEVHRIIYDELCLGRIEARSRAWMRELVTGLTDAGAQGVILGCTELGMLLGAADAVVPLYDTAALHALAAAEAALA